MKKRLLTGLVLSSLFALNPAAAETTIGGYGELHYNNLDNDAGDKKKEFDFHRFVLEFGHDFNDHIRFFSELELEHAFIEDSADGESHGEVELEQAYVEIDIDANSSVRTGVFLIPVGLLNETHEPPTFYGVERNPVEKNILPITWWEAGAMYSAHSDSGVSYDLAIHSGLSNPDGNIRDGRQKVSEAAGDSLAYTARVRYTGTPGLELAGTVQIQSDLSQGTGGPAEGATLIEVHGIYSTGPFKFTALYANWDVDFTTPNDRETQNGSILEVSYKATEKLGVFVRQNNWTNDDGTTDKAQTNIGLNYWPHEDVVFKIDYQAQNNDAGNYDGFNLGVGYQF